MSLVLRALAITLASLSLAACGSDVVRQSDGRITTASSPQTGVMATIWSPSIRRIVVEVDYGVGATPYVGATQGIADLWGILRSNVTRLFAGSGKSITVPTTLAQMQAIPVSAQEFTAGDLLALSRRYRNVAATADTASFHVMILNGIFRDDNGQRRADLLGGQLDGTGVIVIFRPVVASTASPARPYAPAVVEQMALVHEFGHAVGMVANGVEAVSGGQDPVYHHHCASTRCVMNAYNEGATAALAFVTRYATTGDAVLFGAECLADAAAAIQRAR